MKYKRNKNERKSIEVIYEDNHLIAVNKPAGLLVQGDKTRDQTLADLVKEYIKIRYKKPGDVYLGIIHRLDRPVSGVVIFARTSKGLVRMNELFRNREVKKKYLALVETRPKEIENTLVHYILKDTEKNRAKAYLQTGRRTKSAKKSILSYRVYAEKGNNICLEVLPETGRPHQIRVQLASIGSPIRGDFKYGNRTTNENGNIYLHCRSLEFIHPVKKELISIEADLPNDQVWNMFEENF